MNPNSRVNLAWEEMCEDFEDALHKAEPELVILRDALAKLLRPSVDIETRFAAAHDVVNWLNDPDRQGIADQVEDAIVAIQERIP